MHPFTLFASAALLLLPTWSVPASAAPAYDPKVLPKGHEYFELRDGLNNSRAKFEGEKKGRVAFLGGSITAMNGWRDEMMRFLQARFPQTKFDFIGAGIGSLGSVPHAFRFERDVLARGPVDLLFVEAAVNDTANGATPAQMLRGMEGVVRHARAANPLADIVQMHFVMPEHMADYNRGTPPVVIVQHEKVAAHYGCVSLNLALEVTDRINAKQFTWDGDFRNLHPSPFGQTVYANSMKRMLEAAWSGPAVAAKPHRLPAQPLDPQSYFRGRFGAPSTARPGTGFNYVADWTPAVHAGTRAGFVHAPALAATAPGSEFAFDFEGSGAGLMIGAGPDAGTIECSVDSGATRKIDTFTHWSQSLYLPWAVIIDDELKPGHHTVRVKLSADRNAKSAGTALYVFQLLEN